MFAPETYAARRRALAERVGRGLIVLPGNEPAPMNYAANLYPFRQDGSFLYYAGLDDPGLALALDAETGEATLFGHDSTLDDVVWEGPLVPLAERAKAAGILRAEPPAALEVAVSEAKLKGREVHVLPPYRGEQKIRLGQLLGVSPGEVEPSLALIDAVIAQRLVKTPEEVDEIERALEITAEMHAAAMRMAQPGRTEHEVAAAMEAAALAHGSYPSFPILLSRRSEVLHAAPRAGVAFQAGDLVLADAGAVSPWRRYAGDITRTSPVGGRFGERQRGLYEVVLGAQLAAIAAAGPAVAWRGVHDLAAEAIVEGLKGLGLMRGDPAEAVAAGAHALFFVHGLGHALGLDVHDLEGLGEDRVGYDAEFKRSDQFGTRFLRFARRVYPGHVMTVEPGVYLIDALIDQWKAARTHEAFIHYDEVERWRGLGGVRIEDDVVITETGSRILGPPIPKAPDDVEAAVRAGTR